MKKKTNKIILTMLALLLMLTLFGCDFLNGTSEPENTTSKIDYSGMRGVKFTDAMQNYEKAEQKRSDMKVTVRCDMNVYQLKNSVYGFGVEMDTTRIANQGKHYVSSVLLPYNTDETTLALVKNLSEYLPTVSMEDKTKSEKDLNLYAQRFLTTFYHFLDKKVDCSLAMGESDGIYNLKANFDDKNDAELASSAWILADESTLDSLLDEYLVIDENSIADFFMRSLFSLIQHTSIDNDSGLLNDFVDTDGYSQYDFNLKTSQNLAKSILQALIGEQATQMGEYSRYIDTIADWIVVESAEVNGKAGFDKLPSTLQTQMCFRFNVKLQDITNLFDDLEEDQLLTEDEKVMLNLSVNSASQIIRGLNGEEGYIGMNINIQVAENFSYSDNKCALTDKDIDSELFTPATVKPDTRQDIEAYLQSFEEK